MAEELALIDGETLRRIEPAEIQGGAWMDKRRKASLHVVDVSPLAARPGLHCAVLCIIYDQR